MKARLLTVFVIVFLALPVFEAVTVAQGQITHVVQPGDTLYSIAIRYGTSPATIANANGITNWNFIYVGQRLVIPSTSQPRTSTSSTYLPLRYKTNGGSASVSVGVVFHVVKRGETLSGIAARYGTNVWAILHANGLDGHNPDLIAAGYRLAIPSGGGYSTGPSAQNAQRVQSEGGCFSYPIRRGDTLWSIATRNNTTVLRLKLDNRLGWENTIYAGRSLLVCPGKK